MRYLELKKTSLFLTCFLCFFLRLNAKEECSLAMEIRTKTLVQLDEWINKVTPLPIRTFPLLNQEKTQNYQDPIDELDSFSKEHGFFSCNLPLVGVVTDDVKDIEPVKKALSSLLTSKDPFFIELATAELLSKVLAYRNLQKGMKIDIPSVKKGIATLVEYEVDEVLDLWHEMPAFGLLPTNKNAAPILLFRGSDFSLLSKKSWASLLSDLDISGTGFTAFHMAKPDIHSWLEKAYQTSGNKSQVMGFSLGGILSMYTTIFEKSLIASQGSIAFNPPGFSKTIANRWKEVSSLQKIYVTQGDLIPKLGILVPPAFVLFAKEDFAPIEAHTKLITATPSFFLGEIYIEKQPSKRITAKIFNPFLY